MKNVLLIDSGSGGVNILLECLKVCPYANFLMYCDNANLPYGDKSKKTLIELTLQNLKNIQKFFKFDIVVFACNTLTSACIEECRKMFPNIEFIGTVPAIKVATAKYEENEIVVLATGVTLKHNKLIAKHPRVRTLEMKTLASLIDENLDNLTVCEDYLQKILQDVDAKALVLGCTHYVAVKDILIKMLPNVEIFDSANGVARRLLTFIDGDNCGCEVRIMTSKSDDSWAKLWNYFVAKQ